MISDSELNIIAISHIYTLNDFEQFKRSGLFSFENKLYLGGVPNQFQNCFNAMYKEYYGEEDTENFESFEDNNHTINSSPCLYINNEKHPCFSYCNWHKKFFDLGIATKQEFLSMMKYAQPQRKMILQQSKLLPFCGTSSNLSKKTAYLE